MLIRFMEALFGFDWRQPEQKPSLKTDMPLIKNEKVIVPLQFRDDVERLKVYVGDENWKEGLEISLSLQELLSICPRERRRSDAFRKLIAYLKDELNILLTIKNSKT